MPTFTVETGVMVPMRDGVRLATDVYRPTEGPMPTLLTRTPYNKDVVAGFSDDLDLFRALRAGYAVVAQDVRGRFASEGTFDAYHQEAADGADTIDLDHGPAVVGRGRRHVREVLPRLHPVAARAAAAAGVASDGAFDDPVGRVRGKHLSRRRQRDAHPAVGRRARGRRRPPTGGPRRDGPRRVGTRPGLQHRPLAPPVA